MYNVLIFDLLRERESKKLKVKYVMYNVEFVIGYGYRCLCYKAFVNIELSYSSLV